MKIKNYDSQIAQQTKQKALDRLKSQTHQNKVNDSSSGSSETTKASFSERAKDMAKAQSLATQAEDIREAKIAELKRRIANNEYNVKPDAVADRMVEEHLQTRHLG